MAQLTTCGPRVVRGLGKTIETGDFTIALEGNEILATSSRRGVHHL